MSQTAITLGAAALMGVMTLITLTARAWPIPQGRHRRTASWAPVEPGTRWLPCHGLTCAHLTTRHTPHPDGSYACHDCGHTTTEEDQ